MPPMETDQGAAGTQSGHASLLTRSDFSGPINDALRSYDRTDVLAGNALLETKVVARRPGAATSEALKALLAETAETLFAGGRGQKEYRVLQLTYFDPAPKKEAAAERLGLSFSTYRRHLAAGIERLTEGLWEQEQELQQTEDPATPTPEPASEVPPAVPGPRPRLSIVVLPFLNLSTDPSVDHLVDGIVDTLITDLSGCLPGSFIISRS